MSDTNLVTSFELPREMTAFFDVIRLDAERISELSDPPITQEEAFKIAAQGVVELMRCEYDQAIDGSGIYAQKLRQRLIDDDNFPPRELPDFI